MGRGLNSLISKEEILKDIEEVANDKNVTFYLTHLILTSNTELMRKNLLKIHRLLDKYHTDTQ